MNIDSAIKSVINSLNSSMTTSRKYQLLLTLSLLHSLQQITPPVEAETDKEQEGTRESKQAPTEPVCIEVRGFR